MKKFQHEEGASLKAIRGFSKILAIIIILAVAAFGDVAYIQHMQKVFVNDGVLLLFCYLGAFTSFMAIGYLLIGKSAIFAPGGQMLAAWIVFTIELVMIALNILLAFNQNPTGFLQAWGFISPATPVFHMTGVAMIFFLDPHIKEKHQDLEIAARVRQADRKFQEHLELARIDLKTKQLEYTVRELETAINSQESQARIAQQASEWNNRLLTEMSGLNSKEVVDADIYNAKGYGNR